MRAPDHIRSWVGDRYLPLISGAAARASGGRLSVEVVDEEWQPQPQEEPKRERKPRPRPFPIPGATMQPPPDPAKS